MFCNPKKSSIHLPECGSRHSSSRNMNDWIARCVKKVFTQVRALFRAMTVARLSLLAQNSLVVVVVEEGCRVINIAVEGVDGNPKLEFGRTAMATKSTRGRNFIFQLFQFQLKEKWWICWWGVGWIQYRRYSIANWNSQMVLQWCCSHRSPTPASSSKFNHPSHHPPSIIIINQQPNENEGRGWTTSFEWRMKRGWNSVKDCVGPTWPTSDLQWHSHSQVQYSTWLGMICTPLTSLLQ